MRASISVGFAELRHAETLDDLTERADRALYAAKQSR
jgi:PleD family two-component response regulator